MWLHFKYCYLDSFDMFMCCAMKGNHFSIVISGLYSKTPSERWYVFVAYNYAPYSHLMFPNSHSILSWFEVLK